MNTEQKMLLIQSLDPEATVKVNENGYHYVSARIEVGGGGLLSSIKEIERSDHMAVSAFVEMVTHLPSDNYLVTHYKGHRREWRWNGAAFAECTQEEAMA